MELRGVHILLTYTCTFECDHCFVWGSPWQEGAFTIGQLETVLTQARDLGSVEWVYFEGGEPFLYHPILVHAVQSAGAAGFRVGVVSNAYWALDVPDATQWLRPLEGRVAELSISTDLFHGDDTPSQAARHAVEAATRLGIPVDTITIAEPGERDTAVATGKLPPGESAVIFRGRAAARLVEHAALRPWTDFTECPCEDLRDPGRVHVDPLGNVHVCQGLVVGNLFQSSLTDICAEYDPDRHPIIGPLLRGGPAELVRHFELPHEDGYADACHLCDHARRALRDRYPACLGPDQLYGEPDRSR